ncbi:MAG: metallophosphoesterase [Planctomycetaceae bacterium]|jgi:predicted phosphodiesterase|nr:metallophosphoesterase [Planctomycetaceae bacterium]
MADFTFIGDVHGNINEYLKLIQDEEYSIQLGDMGFDYSELYNIDTKHHRFVPGNHENYPVLNVWLRKPNTFPVHGLFEMNDVKIFAFRGAFTIDQYRRVEGVDWFRDEELEQEELHKTVDNIVEAKPKIIVSHDCPAAVCNILIKKGMGDIVKHAPTYVPSRTQQAMQSALDLLSVKPRYWIFGHHHVWFSELIEGTHFVCVPELCKYRISVSVL